MMQNVASLLIDEETQCCANCAHFHQHYIRSAQVSKPHKHCFWPIGQGHCTYPRMKNRRTDDVCEYFERKQDEELIKVGYRLF